MGCEFLLSVFESIQKNICCMYKCAHS